MKFIVFFLVIISTYICQAAPHKNPEKYYQNQWCVNALGDTEVVLGDDTRVDCITGTHSIELDFGPHWYESVGQSLYYSSLTGKKAGIVLIIEKQVDLKYFVRLKLTIQHFNLPIDVWVIRAY